MKEKIVKSKILLTIISILLILIVVQTGKTYASDEIVKIKGVEIAEKSETVEANSVKFEEGKIINNIIFHKVGDKITYKVTIENKSNKKYEIKAISRNNKNENITYEFTGFEGKKINPNEEATFNIKVTYVKEVTEKEQRNQTFSETLTLKFEDENGEEKEEDIIVKPEDNTGDSNKEDNKIEDNNKTEDDNIKEELKENENKETNEKDENINGVQTGDNIIIYVAIVAILGTALIITSRKQMTVKKGIGNKGKHVKNKTNKTKIISLILVISIILPSISKATTEIAEAKKETIYTLNTVIESTISFMDKILVTYEVNGEEKEELIPYGETLEKNIEEPSKEGFVFKGWKLEDGTDFTSETPVTKDIVLVPQFEEKIASSNVTIEISDEEKETETKEIVIKSENINISDEQVKIEYSLDNGTTWQEYTKSIIVTENGKIMARVVEVSTAKVIGTAEKDIINILENIATFKPGLDVNFTMMKLAGAGELSIEEMALDDDEIVKVPFIVENKVGLYVNDNILEIKKSTEEQYDNVKDTLTDINLVSEDNSKNPIYMWFDNGIIYYYTQAETVYLNEDASYMFAGLAGIQNKNIQQFNTSKVKNMTGFLYLDCIYESDLVGVDTSNVTDMSYMFMGASFPDGKIGNIDTSNVTDMRGMFAIVFCDKLNLNNLNTQNVTDMSKMFMECEISILEIEQFDTSKVTNMNSMFAQINSDGIGTVDVSNFNTSNVTDMYAMFEGNEYLTELDVSNFDIGKVTNMGEMFHNCEGLTKLDVSNWNTENVTNMFYMFASCEVIKELDVSNWNTNNVTNMVALFGWCYELEKVDVSNFKTSNVTNMAGMFHYCRMLIDINVSNFDTSNVEDMSQMFSFSGVTELDLGKFDTKNVKNVNNMFYCCNELEVIYVSDKFNLSNVTNSIGMFYNCSKLVGGNGTTYDSSKEDKTYARIDKENEPGYFTDIADKQ